MADSAKLEFRWARDLEDARAHVLHAPTRQVLQVARFCDGVGRQSVSSVSGRPVEGPVLEMVDGTTLLAVEESFVPLDPGEVEYYLKVQRAVGGFAKTCAEAGAKLGMCKETALMLIGSALRSTARVTDAAGSS